MDRQQFLKVSVEYLMLNCFWKVTDNRYTRTSSDVAVEIYIQRAPNKSYLFNVYAVPIHAIRYDWRGQLDARTDVVHTCLDDWKSGQTVAYEQYDEQEFLRDLQKKMDEYVLPLFKDGLTPFRRAYVNGTCIFEKGELVTKAPIENFLNTIVAFDGQPDKATKKQLPPCKKRPLSWLIYVAAILTALWIPAIIALRLTNGYTPLIGTVFSLSVLVDVFAAFELYDRTKLPQTIVVDINEVTIYYSTRKRVTLETPRISKIVDYGDFYCIFESDKPICACMKRLITFGNCDEFENWFSDIFEYSAEINAKPSNAIKKVRFAPDGTKYYLLDRNETAFRVAQRRKNAT